MSGPERQHHTVTFAALTFAATAYALLQTMVGGGLGLALAGRSRESSGALWAGGCLLTADTIGATSIPAESAFTAVIAAVAAGPRGHHRGLRALEAK